MAAKKAVRKPAKKTAKKAVKKTATRKAVKKSAAKKSPARKAIKKSAVKKRAAASITVPPVPVSSRPTISTTRPTAPISSAPRPAASKSRSGNRVVLGVWIAIILVGAIILSQGNKGTDQGSAQVTPTESESAAPMESASESASETSMATGNGVAPLGIVAKYTADGATIFWRESEVTDGLKGYSVETRSNGGEWKKIADVEKGTLKYDVKVADTAGWMSFRISSVYADGQVVAGKVFGLPGQYE